jgi:putative redox protein
MEDSHDVRVVLVEGMHFEGYGYPNHEDDGVTIHLDAAEEFGGQGKGTRPQALLLVSLAACTGMDVISILRKKRQDVTGLEVNAHGVKGEEHPRAYTHITVTYRVTGRQVDPDAVHRSIELSIEKYCPVAGMIKQVVPIETRFEVIEA